MNDYELKPRTRRDFLKLAGITAVALGMTKTHPTTDRNAMIPDQSLSTHATSHDIQTITLFLCGDVMRSSGIPWLWGARSDRPGVNLLPDLSECTVGYIAERISGLKQKGDWVVASIHWGGNWGYMVLSAQRKFAHRLIDQAQVDVVHGHSSHHPKASRCTRANRFSMAAATF